MDTLDRLVLARAAEEIIGTETMADHRRRIEGEAATSPETPCGNQHGNVQCERAAGHTGPCVALLVLPPPQ